MIWDGYFASASKLRWSFEGFMSRGDLIFNLSWTFPVAAWAIGLYNFSWTIIVTAWAIGLLIFIISRVFT